MNEFLRSCADSFRYAFSGWWHVIRTQRNAWIHAIVSLVVLLMCIWLRITPRDWAIIILAVAIVWAAEFFNTALEAIVDLAAPNQSHLARTSKDVGAAAVLIAAVASVMIGILILGPPLWEKIRSIFAFNDIP